MPFNLLLLPLLAGYLFLAKSNIRSYATSQLQKEQLLLAAAFYGLLFLIFSRLIVVLVLSTDVGMALGKIFHRLAPFDYSGTSLGTVLLAALSWNLSNLFVNEQAAGFWLYHRKLFDPLTRTFWQSAIGVKPQPVGSGLSVFLKASFGILATMWCRVFHGPMRRAYWKRPRNIAKLFRLLRMNGYQFASLSVGTTRPVMMFLKDSAVLVGYVTDLSAKRTDTEFVTVLPLWTGYRDKESKRLYKRIDYGDALTRLDDPSVLSRVVRISDISSATIWNEDAFEVPTAPSNHTIDPVPLKTPKNMLNRVRSRNGANNYSSRLKVAKIVAPSWLP